MSKTVTITLSLCFLVLGVSLSIEAQDKATSTPVSAAAESGNREQDGLNGPVRRVRLETAQIVVKDGKLVEGRRELRGVATYDLQGRKIDSVAYAVEGSSLTGKEQYHYDKKGNIIEMVARGDDGSVLSKETYRYEFDELGNWQKMITSVAVYENGTVSYEPIEVSYRTIAYYYGQAIDKLASGLRADASPTPHRTAKTSTPTKVVTRASGGAESMGPINVIVGSPVSDNQAKNGAVKKSSDILTTEADGQSNPAGDNLAVTGGSAITPALGNTASAWNQNSVKHGSEEEPTSAAINLPERTAKTSAGVFLTESSVEQKENKTAERDETSSTLITSTQPVFSSATNTSGSSGSTTSLYQTGIRYLAAGDYEQAVEALNQSIRLNPNDAIAYLKVGLAYSALRKYKEAVIGLKTAIRIKPEILDAEAYYQLSKAYTALEKFPQALEALKQAMYIKRAEQADPEVANTPRSPSLADLHYSTGLAYYNLRRYSGAIEELKQVIALNPKLAQAYYGLALSYIAIGDRKSAEKQQKTVESLDPVFAAKIAKLLSSSPARLLIIETKT